MTLDTWSERRQKAAGRIDALEGLRGLAAIVVVVWHACLAFAPHLSGIFPHIPAEQSLAGSPLFVSINGSAAVVLFFVLSGFVLTKKSLDLNTASPVLEQAAKRYPRLMPPVLISILVSWLLFRLDLYSFEAAAEISGSPWLKRFGYAYQTPFHVDFSGALNQGVWRTFLKGESFYNSSLWTMRIEFFGSFLVFAGTVVIIGIQRIRKSLAPVGVALTLLLAALAPRYYLTFALGLTLAFLTSPLSPIRLPNRSPLARAMLAALGLVLLGFSQPMGFYSLFGRLDALHVNSAGALLLISAVYDMDLGQRIRRASRMLGALSFPIYLIHVPIICSAGSSLYLAASQSRAAAVLTIVACVSGSAVAALPLVWLNTVWVARLRSWTLKLPERFRASATATDPT